MNKEIEEQKVFGEKLAALRKRHGLTQTELGGMIGVSRTLITDYENGRTRISASSFVKIAKILNISADKIFDLESMPELEEESLKIMKRVRYMKQLPDEKQKILLELMDNYLRRQGIDIPKSERSSGEEED